MPAGLEAAVEAEDPRSAVVAQTSFWWRGGALLVERGGIGIRVIRVCDVAEVPCSRAVPVHRTKV